MVSLRRYPRQPSTLLPANAGMALHDLAPLVGPGFDAPKCEIIGIGGWPALRLLRFNHLIGNGPALAIVHGFFLGLEVNVDLPLHVAGAGPAHQRLDHFPLPGLLFAPPVLGFGPPPLSRPFRPPQSYAATYS